MISRIEGPAISITYSNEPSSRVSGVQALGFMEFMGGSGSREGKKACERGYGGLHRALRDVKKTQAKPCTLIIGFYGKIYGDVRVV